VHVAVLNGTSHQGLAAQVASLLRARGFVVLSATNAPAALAGASQIQYGAGAQDAATVLARQVPGAGVGPVTGVPAGQLRLLLGSAFTALATPTQVSAAGSPAPIVTSTCHA
jgi:hypothetical protein